MEFISQLGWRNLDACKGKYVSAWSHLEFLLAGFSVPEELNRRKGPGKLRKRPANRVHVAFKGVDLRFVFPLSLLKIVAGV